MIGGVRANCFRMQSLLFNSSHQKPSLPKHIELDDSGYAFLTNQGYIEKIQLSSSAEPTDSNGQSFWTNDDPNPLSQLIKIKNNSSDQAWDHSHNLS